MNGIDDDGLKTVRRDIGELNIRQGVLEERVGHIDDKVDKAAKSANDNGRVISEMRGEQKGAHVRTQLIVGLSGIVVTLAIAAVGWLVSSLTGGSPNG